MSIKKSVKLVGLGIVLATTAGFAAASNPYGEAGTEFLAEVSNYGSVSVVGIDSRSFGESGAEWLAGATDYKNVSGSVSIAGINELNEISPAASGKAVDHSVLDDFWYAE